MAQDFSTEGTFPGATKTFNVLRRMGVKGANGNTTMQMQTIGTNLSVAITANSETVLDKGSLRYAGMYKGSTFSDVPLFITDILQDQVETEADGTYVKYQVQGKSIGAFSMMLHLRRDNPAV